VRKGERRRKMGGREGGGRERELPPSEIR